MSACPLHRVLESTSVYIYKSISLTVIGCSSKGQLLSSPKICLTRLDMWGILN